MVTHTGVCGVRRHPRNIDDESIQVLADKGGLIGIMFAPVFISRGSSRRIQDVVNHVVYIRERVGIEYVAVGTDFDGFIPSTPAEVPDISHMAMFAKALRTAGLLDSEIERVLAGNVIDFLNRYAQSSS